MHYLYIFLSLFKINNHNHAKPIIEKNNFNNTFEFKNKNMCFTT